MYGTLNNGFYYSTVMALKDHNNDNDNDNNGNGNGNGSGSGNNNNNNNNFFYNNFFIIFLQLQDNYLQN